MKRLYVGNLPWSVNNDSLAKLFSKYSSVVSATIITDRETGRSRGFGFIEFSDDAEGLKAIEEMNDSEVEDRKLVVNEARARSDSPKTGVI